MKKYFFILFSALFVLQEFQISFAQTDPLQSGGPLMPEQAAYDVTFYDLDLQINPADSTIKGTVAIHANIVHPTRWFVINLDTLLNVYNVTMGEAFAKKKLPFRRNVGNIRIDLTNTAQPGTKVMVSVEYGGRPRDNVEWAKTKAGDPWIGVHCESYGADTWWPCKDHPSDRADSVALRLTVPEPLIAVGNGTLREVKKNKDHTTTYYWFESNPVANYSVSMNIAPYVKIEKMYQSISGEAFPVDFWALPENESKARALMAEVVKYLRFAENLFGPYPFRKEKFGLAESPFLGMEHQTINSYGGNYKNEALIGVDLGFDALLQHEMAHEWCANMVTPFDWADLWLNEGIVTYTQYLYAEQHVSSDMARRILLGLHKMMIKKPIISKRWATASEAFDDDVYYKGALMLHTLRFLIGNENFRKLLRRWTYPEPELEKMTDGRQCRFATTDDFIDLAEKVSGKDLRWFFDVYLYQSELPQLATESQGDSIKLTWETPDNLPFHMPVEVKIGESTKLIDMSKGYAVINVKKGEELQIDPHHWILKR